MKHKKLNLARTAVLSAFILAVSILTSCDKYVCPVYMQIDSKEMHKTEPLQYQMDESECVDKQSVRS